MHMYAVCVFLRISIVGIFLVVSQVYFNILF